ncbi:MAG: Maf family protein [Pyrinomonadaceae bacterium]
MKSLIENKTNAKFEGLSLPPLVLASASPRRAEILRAVGWQFEKITADVDETLQPTETPESYVERLARTKAKAVAGKIKSGLVLGADTTVVIDGEIIGKPIDINDARQMLGKLSGKWHEVLTGVALFNKTADKLVYRDGHERTRVKFSALTKGEIDYLVAYGQPLDKAGAYAVQAQAALFIEQIEGDYWNVVGLPIHLVYRMFTENFL